VRARIARIVAPGHPHHVTQRGNRAEKIFFETADYRRLRFEHRQSRPRTAAGMGRSRHRAPPPSDALRP
jgi:hypothetical protein